MRGFVLALVALWTVPAWAEQGTLSADGSTVETQPIVRPHVHVSGDFGGGTMTFYFKDYSGTFRAIAGAAFTSADDVTLEFQRAVVIKGTLSGSTTPALVWVVN